MDRLRVKNERLTDIEEEQRFKNDTLQRKAMMQLQENEEEIKRLNQVRNKKLGYQRNNASAACACLPRLAN